MLLKKAPKFIHCFLWALVALRLVCPFSFKSVLSLIPSTQVISPEIVYSRMPSINSGITAVNSAVNNVISQTLAPNPEASVNPMQIITLISAVIWVTGIASLLVYALVSFLKLKKQVAHLSCFAAESGCATT